MLPRLIFAIIALGLVTWIWRSFRRRQRTTIPAMPERWRLLAAVDERLQEGVNMRDRLAELAGRPDNALERSILNDVDELMASVSDVVELRIEFERHLLVLDKDRLESDSALLLSEAAADRQAKLLASVGERPAQLNTEIAAAIVDLRELYLHVLDNMHKPGITGADVVERTRQRAAELRTRMEAERDLQRLLSDDKTNVHYLPKPPTP